MKSTLRLIFGPPETMTGSLTQFAQKPQRHNKGLVLIAAYKWVQALLFIAIGVGALRLVHKDIDDVFSRIASDLRFNPESRFVNFVLDKASLLDDPMLRRIGLAAFCYAALGALEGIGLYLEKAWGEYLTLIITASFLPWEIHELVRRQSWQRVSLFVVNTIVFLYLLKIVMDAAKRKRENRASQGLLEE
jgi:uncharacterized membrane protein (DUF2068 family)